MVTLLYERKGDNNSHVSDVQFVLTHKACEDVEKTAKHTSRFNLCKACVIHCMFVLNSVKRTHYPTSQGHMYVYS